MNFSIVIPSKNPVNLTACVNSILDREPGLPHERIIVVDDGARQDGLEAAQGGRLPWLEDLTWIAGIKPFIFSRNMNLGIHRAFGEQGADAVILLNDDTRLLSGSGFTSLTRLTLAKAPGICSAVFTDAVGNRAQLAQWGRVKGRVPIVRSEPRTLAFICVCIPRATWETVGPLDEGFGDYGWEDNDYCKRVRDAGLGLFITEACLVEHGRLESTFRPGNKSVSIINRSAKHYFDKYGDLQGIRVPPEWQTPSN